MPIAIDAVITFFFGTRKIRIHFTLLQILIQMFYIEKLLASILKYDDSGGAYRKRLVLICIN